MFWLRMRTEFLLTSILLTLVFLSEITISAPLGDGLPLPFWYLLAVLCVVLTSSVIVLALHLLVHDLAPSDSRLIRSFFFYASLLIVFGRTYYVGYFTGLLPYGLCFLMVLVAFTVYTSQTTTSNYLGLIFLTTLTVFLSTHFYRQIVLYLTELHWTEPGLYAFVVLILLGAGLVGKLSAWTESRSMVGWRPTLPLVLVLLLSWTGIAGLWATTNLPSQWTFTAKYTGDRPQVSGRKPKKHQPNVIMISLDTIRWDELFGGKHPNRFSQLRQDGVKFRNLISTSSWTLPAHASFFTGKLPYRAGAVKRNTEVYPDVPSYVQLLRSAGYRTAAFTDGGYMHENFGFGRGFDTYWHQTKKVYREYVPGAVEWTSVLLSVLNRDLNHSARLQQYRSPSRNYVRKTIGQSKRWIRQQQETDDPFFLFLHTYQAHDYWMRFPESFSRLENDHPRLAKVVESRTMKPLHDILKISEPLIRGYEHLYQYETDRTINRLESFLDYLRRKNLYLDALILLVSDHGEAFSFDPLVVSHNDGHIHEVMLKVPAVLKLPGNEHKGEQLNNHLSLRHLFPMVVNELGLKPTLNSGNDKFHQIDKLLENPSLEQETTRGSVIYREIEDRYYEKLFVRTEDSLMVKNTVNMEDTYYEVLDRDPFQRKIKKTSLTETEKKLLEESMENFYRATSDAPDPYNNTDKSVSGRREMLEGLGYL
ncbi:MAG: sulfatase-like hydrolase/transferase [bacterium]